MTCSFCVHKKTSDDLSEVFTLVITDYSIFRIQQGAEF